MPAGRHVNIAGFLADQARARPDATAIVCPTSGGGESLTYRQLDERSDRIAAGLQAVGLGRGVRSALMGQPGLDLFSIAFAMFKAGAVPVLVDPGIGVANMKGCLATARPTGFIGISKAQAARVALGWGRGGVRVPVTVGRRLGWGGLTLGEVERRGRDGGPQLADVASDDVAAIVFTSGSTGPPKGVVYRHGNFLALIEAIRETYGMEPGEVDLPTFPLFALYDPALGMTTVIPRMDPTRPARVRPENIVEPINRYGVTTMFGSPALLDRVGRWGAPRGVTLPTLRRVISAGAPVAPAILERFAAMLPEGAEIHTPYGATEALPVATIGSREILAETRHATDRGAGTCVGRPVPSIEAQVIRIDDRPIEGWDDSLAAAPGEVGEVVVRGPQVTQGYFDAPGHDALSKIRDGGTARHRMGDLGYRDDAGRLWFCGRKSQRVVTPDGALFTVPCEAVFETHPDVRRAALVGVELGGAVQPVIWIELEPGWNRRIARGRIRDELLAIGARHAHTRGIRTVLFRRRFPVDIRHNAKIRRSRMAEWAARRLGGRPARPA